VRLQLLRRTAGGGGGESAAAARGMVATARGIAAKEGFAALFKGLTPALHRQLINASLRVGLYGQITEWFRRPGEASVPLASKVAAGLVSGAIGITVANVSSSTLQYVCVHARRGARWPARPLCAHAPLSRALPLVRARARRRAAH